MALRDAGWTVLRFWGSDIKKDVEAVADRIVDEINAIKKRKRVGRKTKVLTIP